MNGLPKILTGSKVATYADPTHLNADIDVGAEWDGAYAFFTPIEVIGTVFNAVNSINYKKIINGTLHFTVSGAGFVNGHLLDVAYVLIKL